MNSMRTFGKLLQVLGLVMLPVACIAEVTGGLVRHFGLSDMVLLSAFGVAAFVLGRYVEGYGAA